MPATLTSAGEEVIVHLLKTSMAVSDFIKEGDKHRLAPDQLPLEWKGKSAIVYEQQSDRRRRLVSGAETGLTHTTFAIYCINRHRGTSRAMAQAVRLALATNATATIAGVLTRQVFVKDGERDESLPSADGNEPPERYRTLDVVVHHQA